MKVVKAVAVQLSPVLYSREGTVNKVVRTIHELGRQALQFATFPETVVPYYPYFSFLQPAYHIVSGREHLKLLDQAVTVPCPATHAIGDACKQAGVVVLIGAQAQGGPAAVSAASAAAPVRHPARGVFACSGDPAGAMGGPVGGRPRCASAKSARSVRRT